MTVEALPAGIPDSIYGQILESMADVGLVLFTSGGLIQWSNSEAKRIFGVASIDTVGSSVKTVCTWTDHGLFDLPAGDEKRTSGFETELISQDGIRRTVKGRLCQLPSRLFLLQLKDISTHKQSVEEFQVIKSRLAEAQRIARSGSWEWIPATGSVWWSDPIYSLFCLDKDSVQPSFESFLSCLHPDDHPVARARVESILKGADRFENDLRIVHPDGQIRWIHSRGVAVRDSSGNLLRVEGTDQDITERKHYEVALREREKLLKIVTGSARVGLVVVNRQYEYLFANEAYAEILGLDIVDIVGKRVPDILSKAWAQIQPRLDQALSGRSVIYELCLPGESRTQTRWLRVMYEPQIEEQEGTSVVVVVTDITEQKHSEEAIRESEGRYRELVDLLPAAVFVNLGGKIVFCNPGLVRLAGAAGTDELLDMNPFDLFHPDYHDLVRMRIATILADGHPAPPAELRFRRLDGREVLVNSVATQIFLAGKPAILVVLTDLTERERSMDLLRSVLGSVNDSILAIDQDGTVKLANPATERLFGYATSEVIGQNVSMLMPQPHQQQHDGYLSNYLRTGEAKVIGIGRELEGKKRDGATFPLELTVTEFSRDGDRNFVGVVRDITNRKKLESQFHQSQKMEAIGRLAGGVAHDFNNLLTVINGFSDLILMELSPDDRRQDWLKAIRDAGERAARLTQQLLAFSRKAVITPRILDLNQLVAESASLLRRLIGEDIILSVISDPRLAKVQADPGQIEQVIMNLVVNARDAMPTHGRLTIETRNFILSADGNALFPELSPGHYVQLSVADTGQGMSEAIKAQIFEPFFTTKEIGKGTGLGLSVVHGVVNRCGGAISVESIVGRGSKFTLLFPVVAEAEVRSSEVFETMEISGRETVLLVEDSDAVRNVARIALEAQGYKILETGSAREALHLAENHPEPIHLLLTDVIMPDLSGRELAEAIRRLRPEILALYMSGYMDDAVMRHGIEASDVAFLQKPFTPSSLAHKVREVLDQVDPEENRTKSRQG
ncbi:MAG: PAS domain S-box protein [Planctomycetales bacterium]